MLAKQEVVFDDPQEMLRSVWERQTADLAKAVRHLVTSTVLNVPVSCDEGEEEVKTRLVDTIAAILAVSIVEHADGSREQIAMLDLIHVAVLSYLQGYEEHQREKGNAVKEREAAQGNAGSSPWGL
jgi:hypothetical protein